MNRQKIFLLVTIPCLGIALFAALHLLYSAYAAFSWGKFTFVDYGRYTNMIWNSGHGDLFKVDVNDTYLETHLSFTLALLGPLFHVWDHPFLLSLVQWCLVLTGSLCLFLAAKRLELGLPFASAITAFSIAYPFTQAVILSEFHGVALYLLFVPWIYYCLVRERSFVWLPFVLLLGVREEAGLIVIPLFLYYAIRHKWRAGYVYAGVSLVYVIFAIKVLYPYFAGTDIFARRSAVRAGDIIERFMGSGWSVRLAAMTWVAMPALPFLRRGWLPMLAIPSVAVLLVFFSPYEPQFTLRVHYPAGIMACLSVAMIEAYRLQRAARLAKGRSEPVLIPIYLLCIVLAAHVNRGFLPYGGKHRREYASPHPTRVLGVDAARAIPRDGILLAPWQLGSFAANRPDIISWYEWRPEMDVKYVFLSMKRLIGRRGDAYKKMLTSERYGVRHVDGDYVVLEKGIDTMRNQEVLDARTLARNTIRLSNTHHHAGEDRGVENMETVRYWEGHGEKAPAVVVFGLHRTLEAGSYHAILRLRVQRPEREVTGSWGKVELYDANEDLVLVEHEVGPLETQGAGYREEVIPFTLTQKGRVEPRIIGGDAALWLDTIRFVSMDPVLGHEEAQEIRK